MLTTLGEGNRPCNLKPTTKQRDYKLAQLSSHITERKRHKRILLFVLYFLFLNRSSTSRSLLYLLIRYSKNYQLPTRHLHTTALPNNPRLKYIIDHEFGTTRSGANTAADHAFVEVL